MITLILLGFLCVGILWLIKSQWQRHRKKFQIVLNQLAETQENERKLQEEINLLRTKIQQTLEDRVTQLPNWQMFEDRMQQSLKESERYQLALALLIVDLDEFKRINNIADYKSGDAVLREAAGRLGRCIRQVDSVSRFNKDTFVVMITRLAKPETAAIVAQRILQTLVQPFEIKDESLRMTASIGIATYPQDGQDGASLMLAAQHALALAKSKGEHRYEFFQMHMYHRSRRDLLLASGLNSENVVKEFAIRYQPIVNITNEEIMCIDALLSWEHTDLGKIETYELLQLAEKQQKLPMIMEWLINHACQQFVRGQILGSSASLLGISLSLNVLQSSAFVCRLSQIMKNAKFDPAWLLLQINMTGNHHSLEVLEKSFNMLRYLGVKFAIDEFGSGGLSLSELTKIPVNYFKLDKKLISDISTNSQTAALIQLTLELAKNLNAELIVQGVETPEQLKLLKESGCVLMEGKALGDLRI